MHRGRDITVPVHKELHSGGKKTFLEQLEKWKFFRSFLNKKANRFSSGLLSRSAAGNKLQESLIEPVTLSAFVSF